MPDISPSLIEIAPPGNLYPGSGVRRATYTLCYEDDAFGLPKRIEFEAESPAAALEIAQGEADGRQARLLVDGEPLCQLEKAPAAAAAPYWIIARAWKTDF